MTTAELLVRMLNTCLGFLLICVLIKIAFMLYDRTGLD